MKYILIFILGVVVAAVLVVALFNVQFSPVSLQNLISKPTPTPQPEAGQLMAEAPTPKPSKTVTGGGILSFPNYQLTVPVDWVYEKEILGSDAEKVIIKKGDYEISITQGGFGGSICLFPGDADIEGPSVRYDTYVELTSKSGNLFRRVGTTSGGGFSICEKTQYGWNAPSSYGHISIKTPTTADPQMIEEVDSILSSFETK